MPRREKCHPGLVSGLPGNRSSAGWERVKVGWDATWRGRVRTNEPFPPSQPAQPLGQPNTTTTILSASLSLSGPAFLEGKQGGGFEKSPWESQPSQLAARYQHNLRCDLDGKSCPRHLRSHAAILTQPRGTSRGRRRLVVHESPFPSRNGSKQGHTFPRRIWACGRFPSGKVPFSSLDLALPCSACALLLRCCFSVSRPRKNKGAMAQAQSQLK